MTEHLRRLLHMVRRPRVDRELDEEIAFHLEMRARESGPAAARRRFGNALAFREDAREAWSWRWLDALGRDLRFAFRAFRRSPGFSAVAVLTLALGLGANTAIFAVLYNVVLRPLPYPDADRLVKAYLTVNSDRRGERDIGFSYPKFEELRRANAVFGSMAAYALRAYTITAPGPAERVRGEIASASYFPMLGITAAMGRTFLPEEDGDRGAHAVAILGHDLWRARFAADPSVIGKTVRVDGNPLTIVGVAPPGVHGDSGRAQFWLPLSMASDGDLTGRRQHWHQVIARLKPGATVAQAAAEIRAFVRRLEEQQPSGNGIWGANAVALEESKIDRGLSKGMAVLYASVGFVLLIACANLANLTMARMVGRQREVAIRVAIGAGRASLIRQVLVENVVLAVAGGLAGMLLAAWSMRLLALLRPDAEIGAWPSYMRQLDAQAMSVSLPVWAFGLALSLASGILFGLAPALRASRGALQVAAGRRSAAFRRVLLAGQMALLVVLLVGAGLMLRSFARLTGIPLGFEPRSVLTVPLAPGDVKYPQIAGRQFFDRVAEQVRSLPGIERATVAETLPGVMRSIVTYVEAIDSRPVSERIGWASVDPGFFELFRIPIRSGRPFAERDRQGPPKAILSETAARALFPGVNPVGHRIRAMGDYEIVGVAADVHYENQQRQLAIVGDMWVAPARTWRAHVVVRTSGDPMALLPAIRRIVSRLDPEVPVQGARSMVENIALVHSYERFGTVLLAAFAGLALGLAIVGIYGVFSYAVAARTREFGIRLAAGARPVDLQLLVLRESAALCAAGLGLGIPVALAATRAIDAVMAGASGPDPVVYASAAALLVCVALVASYIPARRAARLDPVQALRCD